MGLLSRFRIGLPRIRSSNPKILALSESAREIEAMEADLLVFFDDQLDEPVILRNTVVARIPQGTTMVHLQDAVLDLGGILPNVLPIEKYELIPPSEKQPDAAEPVPEELVGPLPRVDPSVEELKQKIKDVGSIARV